MSTICGYVTAADVQDYTKAEGKIKNMPNFILPILKMVYLSAWDKLLLPHVQLEAEELHRITPRAPNSQCLYWNTGLGYLTNPSKQNKTKLHMLEVWEG